MSDCFDHAMDAMESREQEYLWGEDRGPRFGYINRRNNWKRRKYVTTDLHNIGGKVSGRKGRLEECT